MKRGVVIVNTSRGGLIDTAAVEDGLMSGLIGGLAMVSLPIYSRILMLCIEPCYGCGQDVYENEGSYFFHDCSDKVVTDDQLSRILTYPNVIVTAHQV